MTALVRAHLRHMRYQRLVSELCLAIDMLILQVYIVVQIALCDPGFRHMHSVIVFLFLLDVAHPPQHAVLPCLGLHLLVYQPLLP